MSIMDEMILCLIIFFGLVLCRRRWHEIKPIKSEGVFEESASTKFGQQRARKNTHWKKRCGDVDASSPDESDSSKQATNGSDAYSSAPILPKMQQKTKIGQKGDMPTLKDMGPRLERVLQKLSPEDAAVLKAVLKDKRVGQPSQSPIRTGQAPPSSTPTKLPFRVPESSLRDNLQKLATYECSRVLMLKKINKLGFNANRILERYFSRFGKVVEVLSTHGIDRRANPSKPKYRPAAVGFMVMEDSSVAEAILQSPEHCILGVDVVVVRFEHMNPKDCSVTEQSDINECEDDVEQDDCATLLEYENNDCAAETGDCAMEFSDAILADCDQ